ncbi:helix-turn-helix domain-containing protein [Paenibacillus taiwanensis]|uniref:helix-turn-helix domain-containing protein n=1 Tax=Paenibacillus taiwanensis TaxID=401638 RepID=UPI0003F665D9|nr:helix-turn-helix transcriptional regulator [Paenibacillus taiwanensis]
MNNLGERLKQARINKNMTQVQVKQHTGIHNKTLSGYENGVSEPDFETLKTLSKLYEVSLNNLLGAEAFSNLSDIDKKGLEKFRNLDQKDKEFLIDFMERMQKK